MPRLPNGVERGEATICFSIILAGMCTVVTFWVKNANSGFRFHFSGSIGDPMTSPAASGWRTDLTNNNDLFLLSTRSFTGTPQHPTPNSSYHNVLTRKFISDVYCIAFIVLLGFSISKQNNWDQWGASLE